MGIEVGSSFSRQAGVPLDDATITATLITRDAILAGVRYEGMQIYVEAEEKNYQLVGGILNVDWVEFGGTGGGGGGGMTIVANQLVAALGTITLDAAIQQTLKVSGNAGPQKTANAPFNAPPADGTIITILGTHAVNSVHVPYVDAAEGCMLKGDAYLFLGDTLTLIYDITDQRYWEQGRN